MRTGIGEFQTYKAKKRKLRYGLNAVSPLVTCVATHSVNEEDVKTMIMSLY